MGSNGPVMTTPVDLVQGQRSGQGRLGRGALDRPSHSSDWALARRLAAVAAVVVVGNIVIWKLVGSQWPGSLRFIRGAWLRPRNQLQSGALNSYFITISGVLLIDLLVLRRSSAIAVMAKRSRSATIDTLFGVGAAVGLLNVAVLGSGLGLFPVVGAQVVDIFRPVTLRLHMPVLLHVALYLVAYDFLVYWYHRWSHQSRFLWRFHKLHHSTTTFIVFTGNRVHPVELVIRQFLLLVPLVVIGSPPAIPLAVIVVRRIFDQFQHPMVLWTYGAWGRWFVFSPIGHRVHHSPEQEHWDTNYGDILTIWDHLFGSWYAGDRVNDTVGLAPA
jgi:sterol desaturase/sphingolipid hydroxylase (fatty acid hydroxylase superfamily)